MTSLSVDLRTTQIIPMNKFRHLFIITPSKADVASKESHIKEKYALRQVNGTQEHQQHLKVWRDGNNIVFEQMDIDADVPERKNSQTNEFNTDAGSIYLGFKLNASGDVAEGYIIVGTGDFRNIAQMLALRYWTLPDFNTPIIIENTANFKLTIHSKDAFQ